MFDSRRSREGTFDLAQPELAQRVADTWPAGGAIAQLMVYAESRAGTVGVRDRRARASRMATLPPCPSGVDLLVEAGDGEQAVLQLMRNFRLPGFEGFNDVVPYEREDEDGGSREGAGRKRQRETGPKAVSKEEFGMGGPLNRVFWPVGMESWLKSRKRLLMK